MELIASVVKAAKKSNDNWIFRKKVFNSDSPTWLCWCAGRCSGSGGIERAASGDARRKRV
jgi:hypothetical protein